MKHLVKLTKPTRHNSIYQFILFEGDRATATDGKVTLVKFGNWGFSEPVAIHSDSVKAALKISKTLQWADGKLNGLVPNTKLAPSDFPLTIEPNGVSTTVAMPDLEQCDAVLAAAALQDIRYYLNGVCFHLSKGLMVGTDGHRMHIADNAFEPAHSSQNDMPIIPNDAFGIAIANKAHTVKFFADRVKISYADGYLLAKLLDGKFPDYERVIPQTDKAIVRNGNIKVESAALKAALAALAKAKFPAAKLNIGTGKLTAFNGEGDVYSTEFFEPGEGDLEIAFNAHYLADVVNHADNATFYFQNDCRNSALVNCGKFRAVVMPMRV